MITISFEMIKELLMLIALGLIKLYLVIILAPFSIFGFWIREDYFK